MRVLILGGDGMLGHRLLEYMQPRHDVRVTLRQDLDAYARFALFTADNSFTGIDLRAPDRLLGVLSAFQPQVIVNAVGIVKQRPDGQEHISNLEINSLLPHRVALTCRAVGATLVHISTDCVFSGKRGNYNEADTPDPVDVYGYCKLLGEVVSPEAITLRTSVIGTELLRKTSLIEWFLAQKGTVRGFKNAIFSGFTTLELSRIIEKLITHPPSGSGIYHVSSEPISKYDLLCMVRDRLKLPLEIVADHEVRCDRSLDSRRFRAQFNYSPPSWSGMVDELVEEIRACST